MLLCGFLSGFVEALFQQLNKGYIKPKIVVILLDLQ